MRGAVLLLVGCGSAVTWPDLGSSAQVDLSLPDLAEAPDLDEPYHPDLADVDLEDKDLLAALTADLRKSAPDLYNPDLAPCGDPNQACCNGTTCDSVAAMTFGWVDSYCAPSGLCEACGKTAQVCCPGKICQKAPQNMNYCHTNPGGDTVCLGCPDPGGGCP